MSRDAFILCMLSIGFMVLFVIALYVSEERQLPAPPEQILIAASGSPRCTFRTPYDNSRRLRTLQKDSPIA